MKFFWNPLRRLAVPLLLCIAVVAQPAQAQQAQGTVPRGSPLNPDGTPTDPTAQSPRETNETPPIGTNGAQPFRPTVLGAAPTSSPLTLEQLVAAQQRILDASSVRSPPAPGEFEDYVARVLGRRLPRFGQDLVLPSQRDFAVPSTASVPPGYRLNVGDTIVISLSGSVDGSVEREIDTNGNIFLPSIGAIRVAGVRYGNVKDKISAAIGIKYRDYTVDVTVKSLRGVRVYVTGFANNPGAFTVSSLSTLANAVLQAGGPASGGSFRGIKLYRGGAEIVDFDLYELVRGGNRLNDAVLQNEDVIFIPPTGEQVAVIGSVQQEAIYELRPGETLEQALAMAGGPNVLADAERMILYRTREQADMGPREILRGRPLITTAMGGDILQLLSKGSLIQPVARQSVLVRVEGEVNKPGNFYIAPNTPLRDVVALADGLTNRAFPFGTRLVRQTVREQQREGYLEAIRQLELTIAAAPLTSDTSLTPSEQAAQLVGAREVLERLRATEPDGRLVIDIAPGATTLPGDILIENNDRIVIPPRSTTVGVFGAVYRPASFLLEGPPLRVRDYIERAGGVQRPADRANIIVVRANGEVLSRKRGALNAAVLPGDVVFVPVKTNRASFWTRLREISTVAFQLGLTGAFAASVIE